MLGHAELRELDEALDQADAEAAQNERRDPYLTPQFAMSKAVTRVMTGGFKSIVGFGFKF